METPIKIFTFYAYGHENVRATHRNTIEFTKDTELTPKGDCILGVKADFDADKLREFLADKKRIGVRMDVDGIEDEFETDINQKFDDNRELVFRRGDFSSERTIGIRATKACNEIRKNLIEKMKHAGKKMKIELYCL